MQIFDEFIDLISNSSFSEEKKNILVYKLNILRKYKIPYDILVRFFYKLKNNIDSPMKVNSQKLYQVNDFVFGIEDFFGSLHSSFWFTNNEVTQVYTKDNLHKVLIRLYDYKKRLLQKTTRTYINEKLVNFVTEDNRLQNSMYFYDDRALINYKNKAEKYDYYYWLLGVNYDLDSISLDINKYTRVNISKDEFSRLYSIYNKEKGENYGCGN